MPKALGGPPQWGHRITTLFRRDRGLEIHFDPRLHGAHEVPSAPWPPDPACAVGMAPWSTLELCLAERAVASFGRDRVDPSRSVGERPRAAEPVGVVEPVRPRGAEPDAGRVDRVPIRVVEAVAVDVGAGDRVALRDPLAVGGVGRAQELSVSRGAISRLSQPGLVADLGHEVEQGLGISVLGVLWQPAASVPEANGPISTRLRTTLRDSRR